MWLGSWSLDEQLLSKSFLQKLRTATALKEGTSSPEPPPWLEVLSPAGLLCSWCCLLLLPCISLGSSLYSRQLPPAPTLLKPSFSTWSVTLSPRAASQSSAQGYQHAPVLLNFLDNSVVRKMPKEFLLLNLGVERTHHPRISHNYTLAIIYIMI